MSNSSFKLSALAIACGLALSACSSGGGDAPSVKPTPTVPGASNPAPGQGGKVETPSSGQNGSSVPTPPGAGGSAGSESTTPPSHNHHEGGSAGKESTTPPSHNHHEGGSAGSESTTPPSHNHHEGSPTGGDTTQPPSADKAYDAAKAKFEESWGKGAKGNDYSAQQIDSKDESLAGWKTELEGFTSAYEAAAKKAVEGKYATEADRKAAVEAAEEAKEKAGQYLSGIERDRKVAEQWKTTAEKALAEAEEMLKAKPDDATAKEYKEKAEALKIRADQFLKKYQTADAQALKTEAERLVTEANATTVKTADTSTKPAPEAGDQDSGDQDSDDQDSDDQDSDDQDSDDQDSGSQGGASTHPANPKPSAPAASPLKTGELGEKYFYGEGEITKLVINGETIDLTVANKQLTRVNKQPLTQLWTDFGKIITSKGLENLIYGAAKLADGSYALFVQGKLSDSLPGGTATYSGDVLHFRSRNLTEGGNWFDVYNSYRTDGSFTATVDFAGKSLNGKIDSGDGNFMKIREFKGSLDGNRFTGTWKNGAKGSISGGFYGANAAEMAGRYSYVEDAPEKASKWTNNSFGVFGGKKQ
ncbi:transferrin-binding protein-like solute binding protein [Neisseria cinerea]|uniref:transferrin-binding protein-like solute binding protein n=1 Tax=Neisseria cinerea TaxID=483 RepID=UPI001E5C8768|nr:transferrin-binding protein-like solute binding protein [Neisseria cinerea]MCD2070131.1 transferrin-binding protein-like solute binding protein [Neisseria cinerea]